MPRGRPKTKFSMKARSNQLRVIERKPIRPLERQRMRPWLIELLDSNTCNQLVWASKKEKTFRVSWKHAAGQTFDPSADASLFELWARHTGKYYTGDQPDPKKWKANFRCALHSLPDVDEDKSLGVRKGNNAFRMYRFLDEKRVRKPAPKKVKDEKSSDDDSEDEFAVLKNIGTRSRPKKIEQDDLYSDGSETGYSPSHESNHSDWALTADEFRRQDHETEAEKSPLPNFEELCQSCPKTLYSRSPKRQNRVPEILIPDTMETDHHPEDSMVIDNSFTETDQATNELVKYELNFDGGHYMEGFWSSVIDSNLDVQEEIVTSVDGFEGPSVIVLEEAGQQGFDYEYTSLSEL